jgi:hypothetical protein
MALIDHFEPGDIVRARKNFSTAGAVQGTIGWKMGKNPILNAEVQGGTPGIIIDREDPYLIVLFEHGAAETLTVFASPKQIAEI